MAEDEAGFKAAAAPRRLRRDVRDREASIVMVLLDVGESRLWTSGGLQSIDARP